MAIPTVVNIVPNSGPTGGGNLLEIYGNNFLLPTIDWTVLGPAPELPATVQVRFDAAVGQADVALSNRIVVIAPPSPILPVVMRMTGNPLLVFSVTKTITRGAGSWLEDGFRAGQTIRVARSQFNNRALHILDITASELTLEATDSVLDEGPIDNIVLESREYGEGYVDICVQNLDASGNPIPGEFVIIENGYKYSRALTGSESDLVRVVRQLVRELRKQVLPNVGLSSHSEYDPETGDLLNITGLAEIPGIALSGPELLENRFYSLQGYQVATENSFKYLRQSPVTYDLSFSYVCVSDSLYELINLQAILLQWARRNTMLVVDRDADDPGLGSVSYEMELTYNSPISVSVEGNESNLRAFSGSLLVRGVDIEDMAGFNDLRIGVVHEVQDLIVEQAQTGESFETGPSPRSP